MRSMWRARAGTARSWPIKPDVEREAQRQDNLRATDEIVAALNERRIALGL